MYSVKLEMPHILYSLSNTIRVIKLRSMKSESHVACVGYRWDHLRDDKGRDGRIILRCMLTKQDTRKWTGFTSLMYGLVNMIVNLQVTMKAGNVFEWMLPSPGGMWYGVSSWNKEAHMWFLLKYIQKVYKPFGACQVYMSCIVTLKMLNSC